MAPDNMAVALPEAALGRSRGEPFADRDTARPRGVRTTSGTQRLAAWQAAVVLYQPHHRGTDSARVQRQVGEP